MGDHDKNESGCGHRHNGDGSHYFAQLGGSALAFYTPQDMLEALLYYHGSSERVRAVRPRQGASSDGGRRDVLRSPVGQPPQPATLAAADADQGLPPLLSLGSKTLRPQPRPLAEGEDHSIAGLVGTVQDAIMIGLGLMQLDVRTAKSKAAVVRPVFGGRGVFYALGADVFVVWAALTGGAVSSYCSCGGQELKENVGAHVRMGMSSSCAHAAAHILALRAVALHVVCASVPDLLRLYPSLDGSLVTPADVQAVQVFEGDDGRATHVVAYNQLLSIVQTPPTQAKQRRPVCRHVPCRTRNVRCIHSLAVKPAAAGYGGFDDDGGDGAADGGARPDGHNAEADADDRIEEDTRGLSYDESTDAGIEGSGADGHAEHGHASTAPPLAPRGSRSKKGKPRVFADTDCLRRARNLLPCSKETSQCARYDAIARGQIQPEDEDLKLFEDRCLVCGHAVGEVLAGKAAELFTLSGRVGVVVHAAVCSNANCGKVVPFDGAGVGLYRDSDKTVYTRTFLDVILFTIITTKSSISAASATSAFQLHCTGAIHDGDSANARQKLGRATDEYSRTMIVPRNLYKCSKCYYCSQTPYLAVVADGQTIGIFRDAAYPFDRATQNVPTIPISVDHACPVSSAAVRRCIRQRLKAGFGEDVMYSKADQQAMAKFAGGSGTVPPLGTHENARHRAVAAAWASSCFWNSFFKMSAVPGDPNASLTTPSEASSEPRVLPPRGPSPPQPPPPDDPAALPPSSINDDIHPTLQGGGPAAAAVAASVQHAEYKYCTVIPSTLCAATLPPIVRRERWSILYSFLHTFLCEPVIGVFAGASVDDLTALARALIGGKPSREWMPLAHCMESNLVVWPLLDLLAADMDGDPEMCRAVGELLMFSIHTDLHMENLWRAELNADALLYEAQWQDTDSTKFQAWLATQPPRPGRKPSGLVARPASLHRAATQADEVRSGIVFPDLDQVRAHPADAVAASAARAAREKARLNPKQASKRRRADMADAGLGDDDCRHAFLTHSAFTPGVVSYLCSCGILIGFEVLETAESPAGIVSALTARFPRLPTTVYFDTACQSSRNATRRVPWLVRLSQTSWALDRFHASAHKCSPLFDANNYPERSGMHKTSAAENRHSLNKPLKNHLTYMGQDRFVVQMRLIGAMNNLLILYRRAIGKSDVRHRPLPLFFHSFVASVCEREGCECRPTQ